MGIIQTRYRDIPWEEVLALGHKPTQQNAPELWAGYRGKALALRTDGPADMLETVRCKEPHFWIDPPVMIDGYPAAICWHLAEIGD